jgi:hypothetical protein
MTADVLPAIARRLGRDELPAEIGCWALTHITAGIWLSADGHDAPPNVRALAAEAGRPAAVVDAAWPDERTDELVSGLFPVLASAGIARLRLVLPRASDRYAAAARTHRIDLIVPAADVSLSGSCGVCHGPAGAMPWLRFAGDAPTQVLGSVYPAPEWESKLAEADLSGLLSGLADEFRVDHIAAGLCLYRPGPAEHTLVLTARTVIPDVARATIVVGAGSGGADAYARFLAETFGIAVIAPAGRWTATPDGRLRAIPPAGAVSRSAAGESAGALADGWREFWPREGRVERSADGDGGPSVPDDPVVPGPVVSGPVVAEGPTAENGSTPASTIMLFARDHRSSEQERTRYRASAARYQSYAVSVRRVLTQRPALRVAAAGEPDDAIVTDFAAVLDFLEGDHDGAAAALRAGDRGDPRSACVISGLRRLPSFAGAVFSSAGSQPSAANAYVTGAVLVEPAFVHATSSARVALEGEIQYVIWSHTGKRVAAIAADARGDEIVFAAGTAYKVLRMVPSSGSDHLTIFLRECPRLRPSAVTVAVEPDGLVSVRLFEPLDEADDRVLERLVAVAAVRDGAAADQLSWRLGGTASPIGVDSRGVPFSLAAADA